MASLFRSAIIIIVIVISLEILSASAIASVYSRTSFYFRSKCNDIYTEAPCTTAGCYWWDDSCHPYQQFISEKGEYCVEIDANIYYCMTTSQNYLVIDGVMTNV